MCVNDPSKLPTLTPLSEEMAFPRLLYKSNKSFSLVIVGRFPVKSFAARLEYVLSATLKPKIAKFVAKPGLVWAALLATFTKPNAIVSNRFWTVGTKLLVNSNNAPAWPPSKLWTVVRKPLLGPFCKLKVRDTCCWSVLTVTLLGIVRSTNGIPPTNCVAVPSELIKLWPPTSFCNCVSNRSRSSNKSAEGADTPGLLPSTIFWFTLAKDGNKVFTWATVSYRALRASLWIWVTRLLIPSMRCATTFAVPVIAPAIALLVGSAAYVPRVLKKSLIAVLSPTDFSATRPSIDLVYCTKVSE